MKKNREFRIREKHVMNSLSDYLFPDASEENRYPYPDDLTANHSHQQFANIKSGPIDGLIWRLSIVFAHCLHILGGLKPLAHLMHEFIMEVRFRYENAKNFVLLHSHENQLKVLGQNLH